MNQDLRHSSRRAAKAPSIARHGRLKHNGALRTVAKVAASVVAVTLISGSAVAAYAAWDLASTVQPTVTLGNEHVLEGVPDVGAMEGGVNLLIVGSDSRQGQGEAFGDPDEETAVLNDVTMLMHISEDHTNASVVSFPRDMLINVPECTDPEDPTGDPLYELYDVKMNTVLSHGGLGCVVKTVETELGVTIPFAGIVQFLGVAGLSEAVGGVDVCVAEPIEDEYTGTFLDAGTHTLSGIGSPAVPPHPPRRRRRQRPRAHLEPAGVPLLTRAHAAVERHARRPGEALLDREGRTREHAAVRQPHGPDAHDLHREGAEGHRSQQDRVHPVPDRLRRGRCGRTDRLGRVRAHGAAERPARDLRPGCTGDGLRVGRRPERGAPGRRRFPSRRFPPTGPPRMPLSPPSRRFRAT